MITTCAIIPHSIRLSPLTIIAKKLREQEYQARVECPIPSQWYLQLWTLAHFEYEWVDTQGVMWILSCNLLNCNSIFEYVLEGVEMNDPLFYLSLSLFYTLFLALGKSLNLFQGPHTKGLRLLLGILRSNTTRIILSIVKNTCDA